MNNVVELWVCEKEQSHLAIFKNNSFLIYVLKIYIFIIIIKYSQRKVRDISAIMSRFKINATVDQVPHY